MPDLRKNPQVIEIFRWSGPHICVATEFGTLPTRVRSTGSVPKARHPRLSSLSDPTFVRHASADAPCFLRRVAAHLAPEQAGALTFALGAKAAETEGVIAISAHNTAILVPRAPCAARGAQMAERTRQTTNRCWGHRYSSSLTRLSTRHVTPQVIRSIFAATSSWFRFRATPRRFAHALVLAHLLFAQVVRQQSDHARLSAPRIPNDFVESRPQEVSEQAPFRESFGTVTCRQFTTALEC